LVLQIAEKSLHDLYDEDLVGLCPGGCEEFGPVLRGCSLEVNGDGKSMWQPINLHTPANGH